MNLIHKAFKRDFVECDPGPEVAIDAAGYRTVQQMVIAAQRAGVQLQVFRAAEFDVFGDMTVNPLHRMYADPVDRDAAIQDAILRGKQAKKDFEDARRAALDKRKKEREDEMRRLAERLMEVRGAKAVQSEAPEVVPASPGESRV